jgi:hypothetical protein
MSLPIPLPTIAFGVLLSICCGALYHLIRGGSTKRLAFYLVFAMIGFWLGDSLAEYFGIFFAQVGLLNAGMGAIISFVMLIIVDLLSHIHPGTKENS